MTPRVTKKKLCRHHDAPLPFPRPTLSSNHVSCSRVPTGALGSYIMRFGRPRQHSDASAVCRNHEPAARCCSVSLHFKVRRRSGMPMNLIVFCYVRETPVGAQVSGRSGPGQKRDRLVLLMAKTMSAR